MNDILTQYLSLILTSLTGDLNVLNNGWMWVAVFIPGIAYFVFAMMKLVFLLTPVWLPLMVLFHGFTHLFKISPNIRITPKK